MPIILFLIFSFFTTVSAEELDLRPFGLNFSIMTNDSSPSSDFKNGIDICKSIGMELPIAKELFQVWCHADLPVTIIKNKRKECLRVGISNTIPNFGPIKDESVLDYWSSTPEEIARNWARGVDFKKGVYFLTSEKYLGRIRCIRRFTDN